MDTVKKQDKHTKLRYCGWILLIIGIIMLIGDYTYDWYLENRGICFPVPQSIKNLYGTAFWGARCRQNFCQCSGIYYAAKIGLATAPVLLLADYVRKCRKKNVRWKVLKIAFFVCVCVVNIGFQYVAAELHWDNTFLATFHAETPVKMQSPNKQYLVYLEHQTWPEGSINYYRAYLKCDGGFYKLLYIPIGSRQPKGTAEWNDEGLLVEGYEMSEFADESAATEAKQMEKVLFTYEELAQWQKEPLWKWIPLTEE